MKGWVIALSCCFAFGRAFAQFAPQMPAAPIRSVSGQFTAVSVQSPGRFRAVPQAIPVPNGFLINSARATPNQSEVALEPGLLAISAERIKESLLTTLGQSDQWKGSINLIINPARPEEQGAFLDERLGPNGWTYWLVLPSPLKPRLMMSAIVNALLVEMANRGATTQSVEVPPWLIAGLAARLTGDNLPTLVLQPQATLVGDSRLAGLNAVRNLLRDETPLTFQELSLPDPEKLDAQNYDLYSACSQLFLEELLRFRDGPLCLRNLLRELPRHLNWQTAFLEAFSPHFTQLLEVEKWWGLICVSFTGTDAISRFNPAESCRLLQDALDVPVEMRLSENQLPIPVELTLQEVIDDWDTAKSSPVVQRSAEKLELLREKVAPVWVPLLDHYLATLQSWLNDTRADRPEAQAKNYPTQLAALRRAASEELTTLDRQRDALRSQYAARATQTPAREPGGATRAAGLRASKNPSP